MFETNKNTITTSTGTAVLVDADNYKLDVKGCLKSPLTDAFAILLSESPNVTVDQANLAHKIVDTYVNMEYHKNQFKKLAEEFNQLTNH